MFFKMLKNDLKARKGLNIILFIFIISASIISVVAANLLYTEVVGRSRTDKVSNIANVVFNVNIGAGSLPEKEEVLKAWMDESIKVEEGELKECVRLSDDNVCINGVYTWDDAFPYHKTFHLTTASSKVNLLYNEADKRFSVGSGCIALSYNLSDMAGIKKGDEVRITTQMGTVYSLTVSGFYKTPFDMNCEELIISPEDFEKLKEENPFRIVKLLLRAVNLSYTNGIYDDLYELKLDGKEVVRGCTAFEYAPETDQEYTIIVVISYFLVAMSIMIIIIMMIMIRYMMLAAIKREENEIGMMRAIGVDSFRYRWMFAATYISFAVMGGIAGITVGEPLARYVVRKFCKNIILRDTLIIQKIGMMVSLGIVILIIVFAAIMMRRIQTISVVEALHGNASGERYGGFNRVDLYNRKTGGVPAFLAVSDMVNSFAKYSFLIISYMLATVILLTVFNLNSTLLSREYQKSFLHLERDFIFYFYDDDLADYYYQKGGDYEGAVKLFVEDMNNEGVPVSIRYMKGQSVTILREAEENIGVTLWFGDTYNEDIPLRKGGKLPVYENEAVISYYTARKEGIKIGDSLRLQLLEYDEDRIGTHETEKSFIITGYMDMMEEGYPEMIAGREYTGAYDPRCLLTNIHLDAPKSEHPAMIKRLQAKFGENNIREFREATRRNFSYIIEPVDALKLVFAVVITLMLALNTMLYTTVDLVGETPAIAILKCVGFNEKDIRKWQMIRMFIILVVAMALGYFAEYILVDPIAGAIFETFGNTGKHLVPDLFENLLVIPAMIIVIGMFVMRICVIKIKKINLWSIREE
ncbi:MAG: FtsX-like permease family protein [Lachnospiraceae bacterium]|nr:FtsX-like permease family protein [Lachnospiraceae bacterium]